LRLYRYVIYCNKVNGDICYICVEPSFATSGCCYNIRCPA